MTYYRKKPNIDEDYVNVRQRILGGTTCAVISTAFTLLGLGFLGIGITSRDFGNVFAGLCITPIAVFQTGLGMKLIGEGISGLEKRKEWIKNAVDIQVAIANRKEEYNEYAETRDQVWNCEMALVLPSMTENDSDEQIVWANTSERVYDKYRDKSASRIFRSAADPYTFLIDGE